MEDWLVGTAGDLGGLAIQNHGDDDAAFHVYVGRLSRRLVRLEFEALDEDPLCRDAELGESGFSNNRLLSGFAVFTN